MTFKQQLFEKIKQETKDTFYMAVANEDMEKCEAVGFGKEDFDYKMSVIDLAYDEDLYLNQSSKIRIVGYFNNETREWIHFE